MKKRKILLIILLVLIIILCLVFINFKCQKTYYLNLPIENKIASISLEKGLKNKYIGNKKELENIYKIINNDYKTKLKNGLYEKVENKLKITFYYDDSIATIIYLYKINDNYYMEQLNNGIYEINNNIITDIENYLK